MIVGLALWSVVVCMRDGGMERAIELVRQGNFSGALAAAEAEADPLKQAQASLYVRHWAGDLEGALAAGAAGLARAPEDLWLNERVAYVALTLRRPDAALERISVLERAALAAPEPDRERWLELARSYRTEAQDLVRKREGREAALSRARLTSLVGLGIAVLALGAFARQPREAKKKPP